MRILILPLLLLSISLSAKIVPVEYFAEKAQFEKLRISPDGKHIAYIYMDEGQSKMAIMNLKSKKGIYSFDTGSIREFTNLWWLNNKRVIVLSSEISGWLDGKSKFYELVGVDINGKKQRSLSLYKYYFTIKI